MNPLTEELNVTIEEASPAMFGVLSGLGRELFFPRGILTQTAEAKKDAHRYNATIGIARSGGEAMYLPALMDRVSDLNPDEALGYAPAGGNPALRYRWREDMFMKNRSLAGKEISLPVVTSGITHGLTLAGELFLDPGDVVVLPDKAWGNYRMVFGVRRGAEIRSFPFFTPGGGFNTAGLVRELDGVLAEKGKALVVLNFPNNPTGYTIRSDEAEGLVAELLSLSGPGRDLVVLLDDAYFGLFYTDDVPGESLFGMLASESEHLFAVKLDGATKEQYAWGLRVGFITFNAVASGREAGLYEALEKKVAGAIRGSISNCSQLSQSILLKALDDPDFGRQKKEKYDLMRQRALKVKEVLQNPDYEEVWEPYPFNAGYFMCLRLKGIDAEELRLRLLERYGVGVIAQGEDLRIAFSCLETDEIPELFDIMHRCALEIRQETGGRAV